MCSSKKNSGLLKREFKVRVDNGVCLLWVACQGRSVKCYKRVLSLGLIVAYIDYEFGW
jgi:hypothetical protein